MPILKRIEDFHDSWYKKVTLWIMLVVLFFDRCHKHDGARWMAA
jgi:hypothetical protein